MSHLLIHIGTAKAGSTAIQRFLTAERKALAARGVRHGELVRGANAVPLAAAFASSLNHVTRGVGVHDPADQARLRRRLRRRFATAARHDGTQLVSTEHLASLVRRPDDIAAFAAFVREFFADISVVAVLRRPDYVLPSSYTERIRSGGTARLDGAFVRRYRHFLDQPALVDRWAAAVGDSRVTVVPYLEADKDDPERLPRRLLAAAGLPEPPRRPGAAPTARANAAISATATELLRVLNPELSLSPLRPLASRRRVVSALAAQWPGAPLRLTPEAADELVRQRWAGEASRAAGWHRTAGPEWTGWHEQPFAEVAPAPKLTDDDLAAARALLRRARALGERPRSDEQVAATVRRALLRVVRG